MGCFLLILQGTEASVKYTINTIAGDEVCDGIQAKESTLNKPLSISYTSLGEMVIADKGHHRLRKVLLNGTIITIAGIGYASYNGDHIDATKAALSYPTDIAIKNDEIYIADSGNHRIRKILTNGTIITFAGTGVMGYNYDNIDARLVKLNTPYAVAFNSNNIHF